MNCFIKKIGWCFLLFPSFIFCYSQTINQKLLDNKTQEEILIGLSNRQALESDQYAKWFNENYGNYSPDKITLDKIKMKIDSISVIIVMGTWCDDSKLQVPRFFKILDYFNFNQKDITIYCVDRNKKTLSENIDDLKITLVPTFIFFKENKEIGRIIETPKETLEKDLFNILFPDIYH